MASANRSRELTQQFLRGTLMRMKLLDRYEAANKVRRLTLPGMIQPHLRWADELLRFHHDRTGRWIHPNPTGERDVNAISSGEDRTPIELFIAGVRGWDADLRRKLRDGKPKSE